MNEIKLHSDRSDLASIDAAENQFIQTEIGSNLNSLGFDVAADLFKTEAQQDAVTDDCNCPICGIAQPIALDSPYEMPVLMNRLYPNAADARVAPRGPLLLLRCGDCGHSWNHAFRADLIVYDETYENDQSHSQAFRTHIEERVHDVTSVSSDALNYVEIGCGQGGFLGEVARAAGSRLQSAEGFDPAWRGADGEGPHGSKIHKVYFSSETVNRLTHTPNVVVSRHTIEHVHDPIAFLTAIRQALGPDSNATLFVETPCIDWILRHDAMQDFFYEHCTIFTARSLALALSAAGFVAPRVKHVFGGQYLWASARASGPANSDLSEKPLSFTAADGLRQRFAQKWRRDVQEALKSGPAAIWGAGAKGVTFALLVDPDGVIFDHVVDINPDKQGLHLPGSGLPVLAPAESIKGRTATYFVMNPNYIDEIRTFVQAANPSARLILLDQEALSL